MKSTRQSYFLITQYPRFHFSQQPSPMLVVVCYNSRNLPSTRVKLFLSSGPCRPPDLDLIVGLSTRPCFISVLQVAWLTWLPRLSVWLWIIILSSCLLALLSAPWLPECDAHAFNVLILDKKGQANQPTTKSRDDANTIAAVGPTLWTVYRCLKIHPFIPILVVSFLY